MSDRYEAIERFAERELELAGAGTVEQLQAHQQGWEELVAGLPRRPPAGAAPALVRATLLRERTRVELLRRREAALVELADVATLARAAGGYARAGATPPRVDRCA